MDIFLKIGLLCLLVNVDYVFGGSCRNGAVCVVLAECKGIQSGILRRERTFLQLYRHLRCGFHGVHGDPMVCCPPEFLNTIPSETGHNDVIDPPGVTLLPNVSVCGIQYTDILIGSIRTEFDEHPWIALIRYDKPRGYGFYCGGVLISSRYVLTAAHCVGGQDIPTSWTVSQVRLGEWDISSVIDCNMAECAPPAVDVDIEEVIPHSKYNPRDDNQLNDIALIRLAKDVPFSDFVKPICLPYGIALQDSTFKGQTMEVVGWGRKENRSNSNEKLKVNLPIIEQSICRTTYEKALREITETHLCAGGGQGQDSCRGDPGGPLMGRIPNLRNWMVFGVESYGPTPCGTRGWPGVYTSVIKHMDWILSNMKP